MDGIIEQVIQATWTRRTKKNLYDHDANNN